MDREIGEIPTGTPQFLEWYGGRGRILEWEAMLFCEVHRKRRTTYFSAGQGLSVFSSIDQEIQKRGPCQDVCVLFVAGGNLPHLTGVLD